MSSIVSDQTKYVGKPCRYGHGTLRYVKNHVCVVCAKMRSSSWRKEKENRETINDYQRRYRTLTLNTIRADLKKPEEVWFERDGRKRKALVQATPSWAHKESIRSVYEQVLEISTRMGMVFHVDHIIPISHRNVCGLHVRDNLAIVSPRLKKAKGRKFNQDKASLDYFNELKKRGL